MNARLVAITTILLLVISGCGYNPARDKDCPGCDLSRADLTGADLTGADMTGAKVLGIHPLSIQKLIYSGALSAEKIANRWLIPRDELAEFANRDAGDR